MTAKRAKWGAAVCATSVALATAVGLTAPSAAASAPRPAVTHVAAGIPGGVNIQGKKVLLDIYDPASNSFFVPLENGAKAAASLFGLNLTIEFANNTDSLAVSQIKTAIASKYAAVIAKTPDAAVYGAACAVDKAGILFIAANQTYNPVAGSSSLNGPCISTYIGQTEFAAGAAVANYMVAHGLIKSGGSVFCPVETPPETYAIGRSSGVNSVISKLGMKCNEIATTDSQGPAKSAMVEYLLGHKNTSAIVALGGTPLSEACAAVQAVGMHIPIGGFDLSFPSILTGLENGCITVSINQEPYAQGFDSVQEVALYLKYGVAPFNINTSDNALITKDNVGALASLVPDYQ
jgi:simple sugar transport system substrate-binding protein